MKKLSLFALAAAGLFLGACSNDDAVEEVVKANDFTDGAFIGVSIQMPSAMNSTRANEDFDDGVASEYAVKDATLYIFKGANEAAAKYVGEFQIGTNFDMDGGTNVTSTMQQATQISNELADEITKSAATVKYYGYVILNNNGVDVVCDANTTFADFKAREWKLIGTTVAEGADPSADGAFPNGLLMTNSPVCDTKGGATAAPTDADNYTTLVELDKSKIFATRAAAIADPAGCIYVERAAVKISVAVGSGAAKVGDASDAPDITFNQWQIINFPNTYYNTRKVQAAWGALTSDYPEVGQANLEAANAAALLADPTFVATETTFTPSTNWKAANRYRFVSGTAFGPQVPSAHVGPFRTYFAEDPTYNADVYTETLDADGNVTSSTTTFNRPQADKNAHWIAMTIPGYTIENTFDVERQKWGNTTQVCFKATIGDGSDFFTLNGGDTFVANPEATVTNLVSGLPAVKKALQDAVDELVDADLTAWAATAAPGDVSPDYDYTASVTVTFKNAITDATLSSDNVELKADYTITGKNTDSTKDKDDLSTATAKAITDALAAALPKYVVSYHKGGVAYYNARIQHFGEYETPWSISNPFQTVVPGKTIAQIYGTGDDATKRFLGRYGVVRDNWYKLSVDKVMHVGTAEPVDVSANGNASIPDDQIENYIAVHVHIIPWVLRNQSVNF